MSEERQGRRRGRPQKEQSEAVFTARLEILLTPEMKARILAKGGAAYLRRLIEADKAKGQTEEGDGNADSSSN